jgi:hypothetical protein
MINESKAWPHTRSHVLGADSRFGRGSPGGEGSRVVFELKGSRKYLHRPHPGKEARRYQVEELREWLDKLEVKS